MKELKSDDTSFSLSEESYPWGESTKGYSTIRARTGEGLIIKMDILISYKLTTSNVESEKAK
jgi:hypothetical protein